MKGGFVVAVDRDLFARASSALVELGATVVAGEVGDRVAQLTDDDDKKRKKRKPKKKKKKKK
jgi:hypothetical protein